MNVDQELLKIADQIGRIKGDLLECAREVVSGGGHDANDWQRAEALFGLAKNVDALRNDLMQLISGNKNMSSGAVGTLVVSSKGPYGLSKSRKKKKSEYPKFIVRGDMLSKVGLRRDGIDEYTQNVPRETYEIVLAYLKEIARNSEEFVADDVLKAVDCPDYQVYVVLGVFRDYGLLEIPRRGFHKFVSRRDFESRAVALWDTMARNNGD